MGAGSEKALLPDDGTPVREGLRVSATVELFTVPRTMTSGRASLLTIAAWTGVIEQNGTDAVAPPASSQPVMFWT